MDDVAIIGAGITGLACAGALVAAGLSVTVLDKGRGIGGRLATRRVDAGAAGPGAGGPGASRQTGGNQAGGDGPQDLRFDHGAPVLRATDPGFAALLDGLCRTQDAAPWPDAGPDAVTGRPGMSQIARAMGEGLDIRQGAAVQRLRRNSGIWHLSGEGIDHRAARLVMAIPAPQAAALLGADHAFADPLSRIAYDPCITLMAGLDPAAPRPFALSDGQDALGLVIQDGAKPGRAGQPLIPWTVHAAPDWSRAHIDLPFADLAARMAPHLLDLLGADPGHLRHAVAHRWLYARTRVPLGRPFLADDTGGLVVGGDWTLGPDAQDGWTSGRAMAAHLLAGRDALNPRRTDRG